MTCRCKAQFCMCCGAKWKSCDCPWFNYDTIETLEFTRAPGDPTMPGNAVRNVRPVNFQAEIHRRRLQERDDEILAHQLETTGIRGAAASPEQPYGGRVGQIHGIGNNAGHFMNEDYVQQVHRAFTQPVGDNDYAALYMNELDRRRGIQPSPPRQANPPPPTLRRNWGRIAAWNSAQNNRAERAVPSRSRTDYESEAAIHAPLKHASSPPPRARTEPTAADLAGLPGRGSGRVDAWRTHVDPGEPPGGVLSM